MLCTMEGMSELLGLVPKVVAPSADEAISFYSRAFGLEPTLRYTFGDTVVFAELCRGGVRLQVKDADATDPAGAVDSLILTLEVDDAEAVAKQALSVGAEEVFEVADQGYGMIQGRIRDPYGVQWILSETTEDLTPEQVQERIDAMG